MAGLLLGKSGGFSVWVLCGTEVKFLQKKISSSEPPSCADELNTISTI